MPARTDWRAILAVVLAGVAPAAQIGKVPAAMTTIGADFALTLAAALLVSLAALLAVFGELAIGLAAARIGARRGLLAGLSLAAVAAALAPAPAPLFAIRIAGREGFLLIVVSAPSFVAQFAADRDRPAAMGLWGGSMLGSIPLGLLTAQIVEAAGWRMAWRVCAGLVLLAFLLCALFVPPVPRPARGTRPAIGAQSPPLSRRDGRVV